MSCAKFLRELGLVSAQTLNLVVGLVLTILASAERSATILARLIVN